MTFTRSRAARLGLLAGAVAISTASQAPAIAQSINATQLSVVVAPIKIVGTTLGGELAASGTGLSAGSIGTLAANGAYTTGTSFEAAANTSFNVDLSVRAADIAPVSTAMGTSLTPQTGTYGSQEGFFSNNAGTLGSLAISNLNAITITPGTNQGTTATAIASVSSVNGAGASEIRRVATSANDQATFESTRQSARLQVGGSGLTAMGNANIASAGLGATGTINPATGAQPVDGVAFTKTESIRTGQAGAVLTTATTSNVTNPGYGTTTTTMGGVTAGAITAGTGSINTLSVLSGNAGTAATLSLIQSLTAF